jgi:hypothetical protein
MELSHRIQRASNFFALRFGVASQYKQVVPIIGPQIDIVRQYGNGGRPIGIKVSSVTGVAQKGIHYRFLMADRKLLRRLREQDRAIGFGSLREVKTSLRGVQAKALGAYSLYY